MIWVIINTAAGGSQETLSSAKMPHHIRSYALRNFMLPNYLRDPYIDELIIVGEWEDGEGYKYVHVPSKYMDWRDALEQRQTAFEESKGDFVVFQHDDHMLDPYWSTFRHTWTGDVIVPQRWTRLRSTKGERLNNGEADHYISGHVARYRRGVINYCPWGDVPAVRVWDIRHTEQILVRGYHIQWNAFRCWDVEFGSKPWQ
jgi:hypothetical protein